VVGGVVVGGSVWGFSLGRGEGGVFEAKGRRIGEKKKYMWMGWVGLGLEKKGMGEGEGGVLEWVLSDCSECKVFFLGRWSFVLYFSKLGGGVGGSFFSELLVSTGRCGELGALGCYLAGLDVEVCLIATFFFQNPLFGIIHTLSSFLYPVRTPLQIYL